MKNILVEALQNNGAKKNYFDNDISSFCYKTGNPVMDYAIGCQVDVYNEDDTVKESYPSLGIPNGSQVCCIGKPSTGKTTWAVGVASEITRSNPNIPQMANAFTIHFDLEQATVNFTRVKQITRFKMSEIDKEKKYLLKQGFYSISDIKSIIMQIYMEKISDPGKFMYDTGKLDEFGKPIVIYVPTVVIIDSIPQLATDVNLNDKKDRAKVEEVSSQTDRMRVTGEISRFYSEIIPYQKEANIILISINQIKDRSQVGAMPSPAEMLYLGQNEAFRNLPARPCIVICIKKISLNLRGFFNNGLLPKCNNVSTRSNPHLRLHSKDQRLGFTSRRNSEVESSTLCG